MRAVYLIVGNKMVGLFLDKKLIKLTKKENILYKIVV